MRHTRGLIGRIIAARSAGRAAAHASTRAHGHDNDAGGCVRGVHAGPCLLPSLVQPATTPRTYIFSGGSPTFATIIPVAAAFVRAQHARPSSSCQVHEKPEAPLCAIRSRAHISSASPTYSTSPRRVHHTVVQFPLSRYDSFFEGQEIVGALVRISYRDQRRAFSFSHDCYTGILYTRHVERAGGFTRYSYRVGLDQQRGRWVTTYCSEN